MLAAFDRLGLVRGGLIAVAFWFALLIPSRLLSHRSQSFRISDESQRLEWLTRVNSTVHALMATLGFYYAIFCEPEDGLHAGGEFQRRTLFRVLLTFGFGYFVADSSIVSANRATMGSPITSLVHHAVSMMGILYVRFVDVPLAYYWIGGMFCTEASTPFINQRFFMAIRHRHQKRYMATGLIMTIVFILVRPIGIPLLMLYIWNRDALYTSASPDVVRNIFVVGGIFTCSLYSLNIFWTNLMLRGLAKALGRAAQAAKTDVSRPANGDRSSPDDTDSVKEE